MTTQSAQSSNPLKLATEPSTGLSDKQLRQATENAKKRAGIVVPPKVPESTVGQQTRKFRPSDPVALERCKDAATQQRVTGLLSQASLPRRLRQTVDYDREPEALREWRGKIVNRLGTGFMYVILGDNGTGKSRLAADVIAAACRQERSAMYVTALDLFLCVREAQKLPTTSERDVLYGFGRHSLLVVDEIENRGDTAFEDRMLRHIIDDRYAEMRDTLLIGNRTRNEFLKDCGASVKSRLLETGGIIECKWDSLRVAGGG